MLEIIIRVCSQVIALTTEWWNQEDLKPRRVRSFMVCKVTYSNAYMAGRLDAAVTNGQLHTHPLHF
jgi:hypothetical protein